MKKFLLAILMSGLAVSAIAQSTFGNRLSYGVEVGPQFSSVRGGVYNPVSRTSVNGGAYVQYDLSRVFKISLGAYYDPRGFETSYQSPFLILSDTGYIGYNSFYAYDMAYKINYLTFPLNFTYLSGGAKFRLLVEAGAYLSIALTSHLKGFQGIYIDPDDLPHYGDSTLTAGYHMRDYDTTASGFFNPADFGLHFAFGLIYNFSEKLGVTFKPNFNFGVSDIVADPEVNLKWERVLKINVGVVYKIHPYVKPKNEYILQ